MGEQTMRRISLWGKVLGILMMITGVLSALGGIFAFVVGAIPGLVTAFMGYLLFKTGKDAGAFLESNSEEALGSLLDNYAKYLLINGILLIVSFVVILLLFLISGITIFSAFGSLL